MIPRFKKNMQEKPWQSPLHSGQGHKQELFLLMDMAPSHPEAMVAPLRSVLRETKLLSSPDKAGTSAGVTLVIDVNQCLEEKKSSDILSALKSSTCKANDVIPECADRYYDALMKAKELKSESVSSEGSWLKLTLQDKYDYYYNTDSKESSWVTPESCMLKESWLMGKEIEDIIEEVTVNYIREKMWSASEDLLLRFQATSSGASLREEFEARKSFLYEQEKNVVKIQ
ncbi:PREDICTED: ras GTPase-activating-like protein IQGAP2, partial [Galeopterus variegatus]|uniref:Ras GTPase-activating-like protein IQGAP2 n=1 Tax=Galeopterus variegatus TaxID=482537 RepID=A0ABM0Q2T9_GALVR